MEHALLRVRLFVQQEVLDMTGKLSTAAAAVALATASLGAHAATAVYSNTPVTGDDFTVAGARQGQAIGSSGWYYNNTGGGGSVGIQPAPSDDGDGAVRMQGASGASKADVEYLANAVNVSGNWFAAGSLGSFQQLSAMSYEWYRNPASSNDPGQHPSMRVLVDVDGNVMTNDRIALIYESVYNGGANPVPTNAWTPGVIGANTNLWTSGAFGFASDRDGSGYAYDDSLAEWQSDSRLTNAVVVGFSSGVGSGWNGPYDFSVDKLSWTIGGVETTTNFSVSPIPEPSEYAMMLAGLAAVGWIASRRRARTPGKSPV